MADLTSAPRTGTTPHDAVDSLPTPLVEEFGRLLWFALDAQEAVVVLCDAQARLVGGNRLLDRLAGGLEAGLPAEAWPNVYMLRDANGGPYVNVERIPLVAALSGQGQDDVVMHQRAGQGLVKIAGWVWPISHTGTDIRGAIGVFHPLGTGDAARRNPAAPTSPVDRAVTAEAVHLLIEATSLMLTPAARSSSSALVQKVDMVLEHHYAGRIGLDMVAREVGFSPAYLTHRMKLLTGRTVMQRLQDLRLDAARGLLRGTNLSVSAIAQRTGPWDPAQFARTFRQVHGLSPSQWRALYGVRSS